MRDISRRAAVQGITTLGSLTVIGRWRVLARPSPVLRRDVTQLLNAPDELKR